MNLSSAVWQQALLTSEATVRQAAQCLEKTGLKIVLVINEDGELEGTILDGDIRRGLLAGVDMDSFVSAVLHKNALVVPLDLDRKLVVQLMLANKIHQIPIVDNHSKVVGLHLWDDINAPIARPNLMVIMAGGVGSRLRPHTEHCPKPLLPIAGRPMLEHIIERAKLEGFHRFVIAVHYLGGMIKDHFGTGDRLGVYIEYLEEEAPLGTAGALSLLKTAPDEPFLVTNGDVITDIRYGELLDFHIKYAADATMAVRSYEHQNPFGVVNINGIDIVGFQEKPIVKSMINTGVYVLTPQVLQHLIPNTYCDMPALFERLYQLSNRTIAYPVHESWIDVGRHEDLQFVNNEN